MDIESVGTSTIDGITVNYIDPEFKYLNKVVAKGLDSTLYPDLTKFYGIDTKIANLEDYNEYGWRFFVEKLKFGVNTNFPIEQLDISLKKSITDSIEVAEQYNRTLFPTLLQGEAGTDNSIPGNDMFFYGTITVGKQKLMMINIPAGYNKIELHDYLYTDSGVLSDTKKIEITMTKDNDIYSNKILWIVVTMGGMDSISDISFSYYAWTNSVNPHRKMNQYLVRNDDFVSLKNTIKVVENIKSESETDEMWMDLSSGTIVGNTKVDSCPILTNMINRAINIEQWDSNTDYMAGDKVSYRVGSDYSYWTALGDSKNEIPSLSPSWAPSTFETYPINKFYFGLRGYETVNDKEVESATLPGRLFPSIVTIRVTSVSSSASVIDFDLTYLNGFVLSKSYIRASGSDYGIPGFVGSSRKNSNSYVDKEMWEYWSYRYNNKTIDYHEIANALLGATSGNAMLELKMVKYYSEVSVYDTNNNVLVATVKSSTGGVLTKIPLGTKINVVYTATGDTTIIKSNGNIKLNLYTSVLPGGGGSVFLDSDQDIDYSISEDEKTITIKDTIDYPANYKYFIELDIKKYLLNIFSHIGFYLNDNNIEVESGKTGTIKIFPSDENFNGVKISGDEKNKDGSIIVSLANGATESVKDSTGNITLYPPTKDNNFYVLEITNMTQNYNLMIWK